MDPKIAAKKSISEEAYNLPAQKYVRRLVCNSREFRRSTNNESLTKSSNQGRGSDRSQRQHLITMGSLNFSNEATFNELFLHIATPSQIFKYKGSFSVYTKSDIYEFPLFCSLHTLIGSGFEPRSHGVLVGA